jgi:hypothetical protein
MKNATPTPDPFMVIPSRHTQFWTQEFLNKHLESVTLANALGREKSKALNEARRSHFHDYQIQSQDENEMVICREPLPRGVKVILGRFMLYALTLGLWFIFDPYLKKPRLLKVRLGVNDQLETSAFVIEWE